MHGHRHGRSCSWESIQRASCLTEMLDAGRRAALRQPSTLKQPYDHGPVYLFRLVSESPRARSATTKPAPVASEPQLWVIVLPEMSVRVRLPAGSGMAVL